MSHDTAIARAVDNYHAAVAKYNANRSSPYLYFEMKKAEKKMDDKIKEAMKPKKS